MSRRRRSPSGITKQPRPKAAPRDDRLTAAPPAPPASGERERPEGANRELQRPEVPPRLWALALLAAVLLAFGGWVVYQMWADQPAFTGTKTPALPRELTEEELLCDRFARLHNAGDPAAAALLGRVPAVPGAPVTSEEVNRLQADYFLREPVDIRQVGPERGSRGRFVFVTKGNVAAPTLPERTPTGVERNQRTMSNPDVVVEVRDGKIYGVRAELHMGP
jgi:hypothetical protein